MKRLGLLTMAEAVLRYQRHAEVYYRNGTEYDSLKIACRPISLLKQVDDKDSIAMRRRKAGWNPTYLAKALGIPA